MTSPIPSEPRTPRQLYHAAMAPAAAIAITLAAACTIYGIQIGLASLGAPVLVATSVAYLVTAAVVARTARVMGVRLGVRRVPLRFIAAGLFVGSRRGTSI